MRRNLVYERQNAIQTSHQDGGMKIGWKSEKAFSDRYIFFVTRKNVKTRKQRNRFNLPVTFVDPGKREVGWQPDDEASRVTKSREVFSLKLVAIKIFSDE